MASLSERAERIKAAIKAAEEDGFKLEADVITVHYSGEVERVDLDLIGGPRYITIFSEEW